MAVGDTTNVKFAPDYETFFTTVGDYCWLDISYCEAFGSALCDGTPINSKLSLNEGIYEWSLELKNVNSADSEPYWYCYRCVGPAGTMERTNNAVIVSSNPDYYKGYCQDQMTRGTQPANKVQGYRNSGTERVANNADWFNFDSSAICDLA